MGESKGLDFGDYCLIEQKRYGVENEIYVYKVVGRLRSNSWRNVPVDARDPDRYNHPEMEDVLNCICCGVCEETVERFRVADVKAHGEVVSGMPFGGGPTVVGDGAGLPLRRLSAQMLVSINLWAAIDYTPPKRDYESVSALTQAVMREGERRGWPDGWWEDPSVIPELAP